MVAPGLCIAIDGPVASGKSAVGRRVAEQLGYRFMDTGAMYRAVAWLALRRGIEPEEEAKLVALAQQARLEMGPLDVQDRSQDTLWLEGKDVTQELRSQAVDGIVSQVSIIPGVRAALVERQRRVAQGGGIVMVGRDIGTVVLPWAQVKVYLVASAQERARRRYQELVESGAPRPWSEVLADVLRRDAIDSQRPVSPLHPAPDAHVLDTEGLGLEEVVHRVLELVPSS